MTRLSQKPFLAFVLMDYKAYGTKRVPNIHEKVSPSLPSLLAIIPTLLRPHPDTHGPTNSFANPPKEHKRK